MKIDPGTPGAATPWRVAANYRDVGRLLVEALAAGLVGSLALALAVLIATSTAARATDSDFGPDGARTGDTTLPAGRP